MAQFQLRTEGNIQIQDVIREMAEEGYQAIQSFLTADPTFPDYRRHLFEQIQLVLMEYIKKYDLCGSSPICSDEVEGAPWLSYGDHIYILDLPENFDVMVDNLAFVALESAADMLKPQTKRKAFYALQHTFRKRLSSYLYFNPICRKSEFCEHSHPVNLWPQ